MPLEREPMRRLANEGQLMAYRHNGSGSPWIPCARKISWKLSGSLGSAPWNVWDQVAVPL